jgi:hypothetical protein
MLDLKADKVSENESLEPVMMLNLTVCWQPGVTHKTSPLSSVFLQP